MTQQQVIDGQQMAEHALRALVLEEGGVHRPLRLALQWHLGYIGLGSELGLGLGLGLGSG